MQRGIGRTEIAIGQKVGENKFCFPPIEAYDIAARLQVQEEKSSDVYGEAADDEGNVDQEIE
jgi:hypothetical protein